MSAPALLDNSHYEQACDQAIAMCDGNLRSTIKALIMANEYLEAELEEFQSLTIRSHGRSSAAASSLPVVTRSHIGLYPALDSSRSKMRSKSSAA